MGIELGRIKGAQLSPNLLRNGVDLTFKNRSTDPALLHLSVINGRIGVNTDSPTYELTVPNTIRSTNITVDNGVYAGNIIIEQDGYFTTSVGPIEITPAGPNPLITNGATQVSDIVIKGNVISTNLSNANIELNPHGTGTVELQANTNVTGNLGISGNVQLDGDLRSFGTITIGDNILDTVTISPDFTQSILPGTTSTYDLGKSNKVWATVHAPDIQGVTKPLPQKVYVSDQLLLDGTINKISTIQSNEDINLLSTTNIVRIENIKFQENTLTNLTSGAIAVGNTGRGYTRIVGNSGFVVPVGDDTNRPVAPALGQTRWNTARGYMECWDGDKWTLIIGSGASVTQEIMDDLTYVFNLMLGD